MRPAIVDLPKLAAHVMLSVPSSKSTEITQIYTVMWSTGRLRPGETGKMMVTGGHDSPRASPTIHLFCLSGFCTSEITTSPVAFASSRAKKNTRGIRKNFMRRFLALILPKSSICWIATLIKTYIP